MDLHKTWCTDVKLAKKNPCGSRNKQLEGFAPFKHDSVIDWIILSLLSCELQWLFPFIEMSCRTGPPDSLLCAVDPEWTSEGFRASLKCQSLFT